MFVDCIRLMVDAKYYKLYMVSFSVIKKCQLCNNCIILVDHRQRMGCEDLRNWWHTLRMPYIKTYCTKSCGRRTLAGPCPCPYASPYQLWCVSGWCIRYRYQICRRPRSSLVIHDESRHHRMRSTTKEYQPTTIIYFYCHFYFSLYDDDDDDVAAPTFWVARQQSFHNVCHSLDSSLVTQTLKKRSKSN